MSTSSPDPERETLIPNDTPIIQSPTTPLRMNIISGTAVLAQVGIWVFFLIVWYLALSTAIVLPSYHPLLNTLGAVLLVQAILLLQPTSTPSQKHEGTRSHSVLMALSLASFVAGVTVIWYNKHIHGAQHYTSTHGRLGLATVILLVTQVLIGATQYYFPAIYGGVDKAKRVYKWHRAVGYVLSLLVLVTATYGTQTPWFSGKMEGVGVWLWIVLDVLVVAGLYARIKPHKLKLF